MKKIKCYNCGGDVIVGKDSRIGICSCCFTEVPIPEEEASVMELYSRANALLSESHFEEARELFQSILTEKPFEAAACWGMAVSEYGIEYVTDPSGELLPTLHRLSLTGFRDYLYTKKAIEYAPDLTTKEFFQKQSALIDEIQTRSLQISRKEDPYDIFICYKKTEEGEKRTADSRMAADYYRELTRRGYMVFFAEETLSVGEEYEPRIFAALHSARVLIAIASRREYYEAVWVRNEWSRYADLIAREEGAKRALIPLFSHMSHEELPEALRSMPDYVEMDRMENPKQTLLDLIAGHFEQAGEDDVSDLRREVRKKESSVIFMQESAENYLTRGSLALVNGEFAQAKEMFAKAMRLEKSPEACLGMMMSSLRIPGKEALHRYDQDIAQDRWFLEALELCRDAAKKEELEKIRETCLRNKEWSELCAVKKKEAEKESEAFVAKVQKQDLDLPSYQWYRNLKLWAEDSKKLRTEGNEKGAIFWMASFFLVAGNILAPLFFLLDDYLGKTGTVRSLARLSAPAAVVALLAGYGLGVAVFLDAHGMGGILKWVCGYIAFMAAFKIMSESGKTEYILLGGVVIYLLYYLFYGTGCRKKEKEMKRMLSELPERISSVDKLGGDMTREAQDAYDRRMEGYRQYYQNAAEWEELTSGAKAGIAAAPEKPLGLLKKQLAEIRKVPAEQPASRP